MAFTEADEQRLEKAIARGVLRVQFADQVVWYNSIIDMQKALARIKRARLGRKRQLYYPGSRTGFEEY